MSTRIRSIIGWICVGLVAAMNIFAAVMKFVPVEPGSVAADFAERLGTAGIEHQLGILEIAVIILYVLPRTSTVGTVLMVGYLGGALATNLTHGFTFAETAPLYVLLVLLAVGAWFRNPELTTRLRGKPMAV